MTTDDVAAYLGGLTRPGAHMWLARRGIEPCGREPGRKGQNLYRRSEVFNAERDIRGYRSDLHGPAEAASGDTDS